MKHIQYPNGSTGAVSDIVADILCKRKGHKIITPAPEPKPEPKKADK